MMIAKEVGRIDEATVLTAGMLTSSAGLFTWASQVDHCATWFVLPLADWLLFAMYLQEEFWRGIAKGQIDLFTLARYTEAMPHPTPTSDNDNAPSIAPTAALHPEEMRGSITFSLGEWASVTARGRTTPAGLVAAALFISSLLIPLAMLVRKQQR